ncbi:hypothetical protein CH341_32180, partial [Rhodoplanes roseus]
LCYIEVEEPDMEKPLGDADRLLHALEKEWGFQKPRIAARLLPQIQKLLRDGEWKVTCAVYTDGRVEGGGPIVTAIFPGFHNVGCGLAVDIGS